MGFAKKRKRAKKKAKAIESLLPLEEAVLYLLSTVPDDAVLARTIYEQIRMRVAGKSLLDVEDALEKLAGLGFVEQVDRSGYGAGSEWIILKPGRRYLQNRGQK